MSGDGAEPPVGEDARVRATRQLPQFGGGLAQLVQRRVEQLSRTVGSELICSRARRRSMPSAISRC